MLKLSRTHLAAGVTVAALGALGAVAFAAGSGEPEKTATSAPAAPEVRTIIERRTETVVRHERPRHRSAADAAASGSSPPTAATPAQTRIVPIDATSPASPRPAGPLRSGSSAAAGDDDHEEHGDRGEDHDDDESHHEDD
ncbi:MAG: hypothetical protein LT070_06160 [Solirubrobacteraceae bacterium]|nr:hypothetical protein [Solirubrobacteraceae bacterium]